jgi:hypothetical protein
MKALAAILAIALVPAAAEAAKPAPKWQDFAACATAYRVNAAIADPGRSASMKAQIAETGDDYETAAVARYKAQTKSDEAKAKAVVESYAISRAPAFKKQTREQVEKFIDACPQTED